MEKQKFGEDFTIKWDIDENIDTDHLQIIPMMLQIPVENALKHGLSQVEGKKTVVIKIRKEGTGIKVRITDNGTGYYPEKESRTSGTGTGLKVLNQTIEILNLQNAEKITFSLSKKNKEKQNGTSVELFIPFNYQYKCQ